MFPFFSWNVDKGIEQPQSCIQPPFYMSEFENTKGEHKEELITNIIKTIRQVKSMLNDLQSLTSEASNLAHVSNSISEVSINLDLSLYHLALIRDKLPEGDIIQSAEEELKNLNPT